MLEVSTLMRKYGRFTAVKDASFSIQHGEIVGLLGHNGAGKTTILKMLSGYLEPHQGQITLDGIDVIQTPRLAQQRIGYLPENLPVYPEMLVADYLDYAANLKGIRKADRIAEIRRVLKATDIQDKILAPIATLSRGYKQRVGVAQALLGQPKLLILDEPTNGLDPTQTAQMRALIRDVARHATVILSTHIMQEVDALCDRVLIIRAGELAMDARLSALRQSSQLKVHCSLAYDTLQTLLGEIDGVSELQSESAPQPGPIYHYLVHLAKQAESEALSAQIARRIIEHGGALQLLQPAVVDLESLFRQVNQQSIEESHDAA